MTSNEGGSISCGGTLESKTERSGGTGGGLPVIRPSNSGLAFELRAIDAGDWRNASLTMFAWFGVSTEILVLRTSIPLSLSAAP